jgi:hypothetical protein
MRFSHSLVYSAFTSFLLIQNCAVALSSSKLPRVGAVINGGSGVGCSLHFPDDKAKKKKTIYSTDVDGVYMNLDGKDTKLTQISRKLNKKKDIYIYISGATKIRVESSWLKNRDNNTQAKIIISRDGQSKNLRLIGYCGC